MGWRAKVLTAGSLALILACAGPKETADDSANDSDDVTDESGGGGDDDSADDTSFGEVFERGDPSLSVSFNGAQWTSEVGYYIGSATSYINASGGDESRSQTLTIEVAGNLRYADTYTVTSISYAEGPAQGTVDVNYMVRDPSGVTFTVRGYAEETYIFGELSGSATLTDTVGGGGDADFSGLVLESWPKF